MTDKTLKKARGLNSIADPSKYKGSSGRKSESRSSNRVSEKEAEVRPDVKTETENHTSNPKDETRKPVEAPVKSVSSITTGGVAEADQGINKAKVKEHNIETDTNPEVQKEEPKLEPLIDLTSRPMPRESESLSRESSYLASQSSYLSRESETSEKVKPKKRGRKPNQKSSYSGRKKITKDISVPLPTAEAVENTLINPSDILMAAYGKFNLEIRDGRRGRMISRGRERLRITLLDDDYKTIKNLGEERGWNFSEIVSVLLAAELLGETNRL